VRIRWYGLPWWWWLGVALVVGYDDAVRLFKGLGLSDSNADLAARALLLLIVLAIVGAAVAWVLRSGAKGYRQVRRFMPRIEASVQSTCSATRTFARSVGSFLPSVESPERSLVQALRAWWRRPHWFTMYRERAYKDVGTRFTVVASDPIGGPDTPLSPRTEQETFPLYRYIGGAGGEYYHEIPARDLTEAEYDALRPDLRELVDNGKLYTRVRP